MQYTIVKDVKEIDSKSCFLIYIARISFLQFKAFQLTQIKNFTIFINQNFKKLASENDHPTNVYTYWARHSFATNAISKGATMAFVGDALYHKNPKTTIVYFAGFEEKSKRELALSLMDFEIKNSRK